MKPPLHNPEHIPVSVPIVRMTSPMLTMKKNPRSLLNSTWYEKSRPGHMVRIIGAQVHIGSWAANKDRVIITHLTAHNKRAQSSSSIIKFENFCKRYVLLRQEVYANDGYKIERVKDV